MCVFLAFVFILVISSVSASVLIINVPVDYLTIQDAINNASPDSESSIFKNLTEALQSSGIDDSRVLVEALIKLWAIWYKGVGPQFEISFYIEHRESAWLQFRNYIKQNQIDNFLRTGLALSKKYVPAEMQTTNN